MNVEEAPGRAGPVLGAGAHEGRQLTKTPACVGLPFWNKRNKQVKHTQHIGMRCQPRKEGGGDLRAGSGAWRVAPGMDEWVGQTVVEFVSLVGHPKSNASTFPFLTSSVCASCAAGRLGSSVIGQNLCLNPISSGFASRRRADFSLVCPWDFLSSSPHSHLPHHSETSAKLHLLV